MMLRRAQTRGLCRSHQVTVHIPYGEHLSSTTTATSHISTHTLRRHASRPLICHYRSQISSTRQFSSTKQHHDTSQTNEYRTRVTGSAQGRQYGQFKEKEDKYEDSREREEILASDDALELLEKELGRPIKETMERGESDARQATHDADETSPLQHPRNEILLPESQEVENSETVKNSPVDDVAATLRNLRDNGASGAEIVRGVRQVFGDVLPPEGVLQEDEVKLYKRLYGEPSRLFTEEHDETREQSPQLLDSDGENIPYKKAMDGRSPSSAAQQIDQEDPKVREEVSNSEVYNNSDQLTDIAQLLNGEVIEDQEYNEVEEEEEDDDPHRRTHPFSKLARFGTSPSTVFLSEERFIRPVEAIMSKFSNKQLKDMCERTFGGEGLPHSALTPRSGRAKQQIAIPLEATQFAMGEMEANAFLTAIMPPTYASIRSVLVETRKRLGPTWLNRLLSKEGGPRVLDASGGGVGIIAWREIVQAHWDSMHSSDRHPPAPPASRTVVLTGSDTLRHRAAALLDNTTFIPRLPDYSRTRDAPTLEDDRPAQPRKQFDVIIAPHSLFGLKEDWQRRQHVHNLWSMLSPDGGVLVLIEKGVSRAFDAITAAREVLLDRYIAVPPRHFTRYSNLPEDPLRKRQTGMIIAPCTNHERCPLQTVDGRGKRDICSFQQRYIRPAVLQRVLGAKDRNHDDVDFTYLAVMKGDDLRLRQASTWQHLEDPVSAPLDRSIQGATRNKQTWTESARIGFETFTPDSTGTEVASPNTVYAYPDGSDHTTLPTASNLPRSIFQPIKRRGHVTMDLCTTEGKIERWTVPRSYSKQAYRDARKSRWGDLWALGAKTHRPRNIRLGTFSEPTSMKGIEGEEGIKIKARGRKERLKMKARDLLERRERERLDELEDMAAFENELIEEDALNDLLDNDVEDRPTRPRRSETNPRRSGTKPHKSPRQTNPSPPPEHKSYTPYHTSQPTSPPPTPSSSSLSDLAINSILADWNSDFAPTRTHGRGGRQPQGKMTREARRLQKSLGREKAVKERAETGDAGDFSGWR